MTIQTQRIMASTLTATFASIGVLLLTAVHADANPVAAIALLFFTLPFFVAIDAVSLPVIWKFRKHKLNEADNYFGYLRYQSCDSPRKKCAWVGLLIVVCCYIALAIFCTVKREYWFVLFILCRLFHWACWSCILLAAIGE